MAARVSGGAAGAGVFLVSGGQIVPLALLGSMTPLGGEYAGFSGGLGLTNDGAVAFNASIRGGQANQGIFLAGESETTALVTTNDLVPDGARLTGLQIGFPLMKRLALNQQAEVAFIADIAGGEGDFFGSAETIRPIAHSGQVLENGDQLVRFGRVGLNRRGALVFTADRRGGGVSTCIGMASFVALSGRGIHLLLEASSHGPTSA